MSARALGWLLVAAVVVGIIAAGGPSQAWATVQKHLPHGVPAATSTTTGGTSGGTGETEDGGGGG